MMDPGLAAIIAGAIGFIGGGGIALYATHLTNRAATDRASVSFRRDFLQKKIERLRETYTEHMAFIKESQISGSTKLTPREFSELHSRLAFDAPESFYEFLEDGGKDPTKDADVKTVFALFYMYLEKLERELHEL